MNLELKLNEEFKNFIVEQGPHHETGVHYVFKFENGLGASVVKHDFSYGNKEDLWELAVIMFIGPDGKWTITYETEITPGHDVIGYLTDEEVNDILSNIKNYDSFLAEKMNEPIVIDDWHVHFINDILKQPSLCLDEFIEGLIGEENIKKIKYICNTNR